MGGYFTSDRAAKYGWGVPRLALVTLFAFEIVPRALLGSPRPSTPSSPPCRSPPKPPPRLRPHPRPVSPVAALIVHAYTGSIGAGVNVQVLGLLGNLAIMAVAGGLCLWDLTKDISLVVYFLKTFCGDQLAGKLDTAEWKLVLAFTFALPLRCGAPRARTTRRSACSYPTPGSRPCSLPFKPSASSATRTSSTTVIGKFFRHRYGFEAFTLCALTMMPEASPLRNSGWFSSIS